jgi:Ulp1 protease family, C-terminal catalytic domain
MAKTEAATEEPKGDQVPKKNINKAEQAKVWKEQTERTRLNFIEIAHDTTTEKDLRAFAIQFAEIIKLWQSCAKEENPTYHNIEFGQGLKLNLRQVFALLAEEYQKCILVDDQDRSPNRNGYDMSWLDDQTMNVLVQLACRPGQDSVRFGRDLMSGVRIQLDEMMLKAHSASYLEYHVRAMLENKPRSDWMADELYSFPPSTKRIVYFFNYTETHWTLIATDVSREKWTHTLYNSLETHPKGATWNAAQKQLPLIEVLIQGASALPKPKRSEIVAGKSARQTNSYDCGVITVYNAVQLLNGRKPEKRVDAKQLRLEYVTQILSELKSGVSSNSADSFTPDSSGTDFSSANSNGEHNTSIPVSGDAIERNKKDVKEHEGSGLIPACNDLDKPHMQHKLHRSKWIENLEEKKRKSAPLRLQGQSKDNELRSADDIIDPTSSLTSEEKAVLQRIRGPLSSKVVLEVLESIKSMSLEPSGPLKPMFPTESIRIQIVPPDVWNEFDVDELGEGLRNEDPEFRKLFASKLKGVFRPKLFELFADYLTPPHSDLRLLNPQPDDNSIPETPQFVLLPFCRDSFWKMIVVTLTSTYCSCQIYEPGCDSGGQWDGLKDVLGQIFRAVFGVGGKRIRWDRFQTVDLSRKQARMKDVDSGVWIIEYATAWLMEYTKAVTHNNFLSDPMFGMKTELDTNVARINFAKMLVGKDIWQSHDLVESAHEVPGGSLDVSKIFTTDAWEDDPVELEDEDDSDSDRDSEYEVNSISSPDSSASDTGSEFESDEDQSWELEDASELEYDSESEVTTKLVTEGRCLPAFLPCQAEDWAAEDASQELDSPDAEDLGSSPRHLIDEICDEKNPEACATRFINAERVALLTFTREECEEILNRLGPKPKLECLSGKSNQP